jgi:hypothetical protein
MMNDKKQMMTMLKEEFDRWEGLLSGLTEEQITAPQLDADMSIKDVVAHLWTWQKRSIARLEAAMLDREPEFPEWIPGVNPDSDDEKPDQINAWIFETCRDRSWPDVHRDWRAGFLRFLELGEAIPEKDLFDAGRYPWMGEYTLAHVLLASYEHHHVDHLEPLAGWLRSANR